MLIDRTRYRTTAALFIALIVALVPSLAYATPTPSPQESASSSAQPSNPSTPEPSSPAPTQQPSSSESSSPQPSASEPSASESNSVAPSTEPSSSGAPSAAESATPSPTSPTQSQTPTPDTEPSTQTKQNQAAYAVNPNSPIGQRYRQSGGESGPLGRATDKERCGLRNGGCYQLFQRGAIYHSKFGTKIVLSEYLNVWSSLRREAGPLGYPISERICGLKRGGCYQSFEDGNIYRTPEYGALPVRGGIFRSWTQDRRENGALGYPKSGEICGGSPWGCYQNFESGRILYTPKYGTYRMQGVMHFAYAREGSFSGKLGWPTSNVRCGLPVGGCSQDFAKGSLYYTPKYGTHVVRGRVGDTWRKNGGYNGILKFPIRAETCSGNTCTQGFENGSVILTNGVGRIELRKIAPTIRQTTNADVRSTYRNGCPVPPSQLRTITMNYWDYGGRIQRGDMIVRSNIVSTVIGGFGQAFDARSPIAHIANPNIYGGNDPKMMYNNLTSAFNCRQVVGSPYSTSPHSYGTAIDVNSVQNPYRDRKGKWWPSNGSRYIQGAVLNRKVIHPGMYTTSSPLVRGLEGRGLFWGGRWSPGRDYQHFMLR